MEPYEGDCEYVFVSYAHADRDAVLPIIRALDGEGYRVWYDEGVGAGTRFPDRIADRVYDCACVVAFISRSWASSMRCGNEVEYAIKRGKGILPIYLV